MGRGSTAVKRLPLLAKLASPAVRRRESCVVRPRTWRRAKSDNCLELRVLPSRNAAWHTCCFLAEPSMTAPMSPATPPPCQRTALLVSAQPWGAGVRELLQLSGYVVRTERSIAAARESLTRLTPQLAIVGDVTVEPEIAELLNELRAVCPRLIVTHQRDAAWLLAARLGVLVEHARSARC